MHLAVLGAAIFCVPQPGRSMPLTAVRLGNCVRDLLLTAADASSLNKIYGEAKDALEAGDAAKAVALLEPALADATEGNLGPAQLALGLAYLRIGKPEPAVTILEKAAKSFAGEPQEADASALLGDATRRIGKVDEAKKSYQRAKEVDGESVNGRYAAARLSELEGEAAESAGDYAKAAASYLSAGDALLALGSEDSAYLTDARALFEKVAKGPDLEKTKGKSWRGEPTARAVFSMGEIERARGMLPEAIAYYQRTFVSWLKYPQWPARAYLRAAECMDKLGKRAFAIRHLREMVRKVDKFGKLPEYEQAKKQLRAWGENVQ